MWGAGSVIRGSGSQIRSAGSEIRRDPPQFNHCVTSVRRILVRGVTAPLPALPPEAKKLLSSPPPIPIQKTAFFVCFRFLIFRPFFRGGGQMTPFAPMCGHPCSRLLFAVHKTRGPIYKYLTTDERSPYDNAKVTTDFRRTSVILRRTQGVSSINRSIFVYYG